MTKGAMPVVFHHHAYKCAGTTFVAILESNFPGQVAYVEADSPRQRLAWQAVAENIRATTPRAVSSHLATVPPRGQALAALHVAFVRQPRDRLVSAFLFQQRTKDPKLHAQTFVEYLDSHRHRIIANYQTRHLSGQDQGGWARRRGWELRPELISFSRPDLLIGVVERMDESLLALERCLAARGEPFDAAYGRAENATMAPTRLRTVMADQIPDTFVELDDVLYARANAALSAHVRQLGINTADLAEFGRRCAARAGAPTVTPSPETWTYIRPVPPPTGAHD